MNDLLAKLESAECGSRELDRSIEAWRCNGALVQWEFPPYTTSLDAALTLVPEGWWYVIRPDSAILGPPNACDDCDSKLKDAFDIATAPLALCIAALKARQANDQSS